MVDLVVPYKDLDRQREYQRNWAASRREQFFRDKSCAHCGATRPLQIDHIDPGLKVSHKIWTWSAARREAEIAKCQILCHNCHWLKSQQERPKTDHGRGWMYQRYRCRCKKCKAWKLAESRRYAQVRKARGA